MNYITSTKKQIWDEYKETKKKLEEFNNLPVNTVDKSLRPLAYFSKYGVINE